MKTLFSATHWLSRWQNQGIRVKLAALLLASTGLSVMAVTYAVLKQSEEQLRHRLQTDLNRQSDNFGQELKAIAADHELKAAALAQQLRMLELDLNNSAPHEEQLRQVLANSISTGFEPNFLLITDGKGRVIAQRSQVLADWEKMLFLPQPGTQPDAGFRPVTGVSGIDLKQIPIVRDALDAEQAYTSAQLVPQSVLTALGLAAQSSLPIRWQPSENLPEPKRPLPIHTLDRSSGLVVMSVTPIKSNGNVVGTAVVGTLLNCDYALVDQFQRKSQVSAVTIFAQDMQIATTVPYNQRTTRAIATLSAREVSQVVLQQGKPFIGETSILSKPYMAAYQPIYDHRYASNPKYTKPIGMYLVAESSEKIDQILNQIASVGYAIGGGILLLVSIILIPISRRFAAPIEHLTQLAEQVGQGKPTQFDLGDRTDEVGILARELNHMIQRLHKNLAIVKDSEAQFKRQAEQLAGALKELKQAQTQLVHSEKMSSLGQLVAGVAHEINNPVSFIYGNIHHAQEYVEDLLYLLNLYQGGASAEAIVQAMQERDLEFAIEDLPKTLSSMEMGANRIREIVLSLRSFSRLDEASYKAVDLHDGLNSTLLILDHRLKAQPHRAKIEVIKQYDGKLPLVECYAGQLNQVFMNLLANAIDALEEHLEKHPEFQPHITITTQSKSDHYVKISVADNGTGIPESVRERLFDPFFTTKPVGQGTGLGLSISYQIITQAHHGTIECFSIPDMGTEFVLTLPVQLPIAH